MDDLRPEYDLAQLKDGVRGKYYGQMRAGTNLVLIEPDLFHLFPDSAAVNRAPRLVAGTQPVGNQPVTAAKSRRVRTLDR